MWILLLLLAAPLAAQTWVNGEIGFRLNTVPKDSPAERASLKIGDILLDPAAVPAALRRPDATIPVYRFDEKTAAYQKENLKIAFKSGEERRLQVIGDLGFLVTSVEPKSVAAQAGLRPHDFIPQIDGAFVHEISDLSLVDRAKAQAIAVDIYYTRWSAEKKAFENSIAHPKFTK